MLKSIKLSRLASILLAVLTVVSLLTPVAYAAVKTLGIPSVEFSAVYVNPRFSDEEVSFNSVYVDDVGKYFYLSPEFEHDTFEAAPTKIYEDIEDAADFLRECFAQRQEKITFYMKAEYISQDDVYMIADVIEAHTGNPRYGDAIAFQYSTFQYACRYMSTRKSCYYTFDVTYYTTAEQEEEFDKKLYQVMEDMNLDGQSDYRKVRMIYDYITSNVVYDKGRDATVGPLKYTAYNALCKGRSVCQGYAVLFYRMCLEQGIDARIITGKSHNEAHAWNIVKIGDEYYLCDATWDSPINYFHEYFLKCENGFSDHTTDSKFKTDDFVSSYPIAKNNLLDNADNMDWSIENGVLKINSDYDIAFRDDNSTVPWDSRKNEVTKVVIGGDIRVLGSRSFEGMSNLTDVTFHERTRDIGYWCFAWCSKLKTLVMPNYIESIGKYAFYNCTSLTDIKFSSGLTTIDDGAFYNCTSLKSVVLPEGVKKIGANAFACPIDTITIPRSIDSAECIASNAFTYKARLTVRCKEGSYIIEYCKKYNIKYVIIDDIPGDINEDGIFDAEDLDLLLDSITGTAPISEALKEIVDVNNDGVVDIRDYNILYSRIYNTAS